MLSPLLRALAFYLGGGYVFALLFANWLFDLPANPDAAWRSRVRRQVAWLATAGLAHPVVALASVWRARDLHRAEGDSPSGLTGVAVSSAIASLAGMTATMSMVA